MNERFDRLAILRGDRLRGLPASAWEANLGDLDRDQVLRAVIEVIRALVLPTWAERRPDDRRPQIALEATEAWLAAKSPATVADAKAAAKACTAARTDSFGYDQHIAEAARAVAWSAGAKDSKFIWEALIAVESQLLAQIAMVSEYHRQPEQRRAIVDALRKALTEPAEPAPPVATDEVVPYAASGTFSVGQRLRHATFGTVVVTAVVDKSVEVQLEDGTRKRLAHKNR